MKVKRSILLSILLLVVTVTAAWAAYEFWAGTGEVTVGEAMVVTWEGGDGSWDPATLSWTVTAYPGETVTADFDVQNDGSEQLQVIATATETQPLTGTTSSWDVTSECINSGQSRSFELSVVVSAEAAPGTLLLGLTFQREACP